MNYRAFLVNNLLTFVTNGVKSGHGMAIPELKNTLLI